MGGFSGSVADLYATLGIDSTQFNAGLAVAEAQLRASGDRMAFVTNAVADQLRELKKTLTTVQSGNLDTSSSTITYLAQLEATAKTAGDEIATVASVLQRLGTVSAVGSVEELAQQGYSAAQAFSLLKMQLDEVDATAGKLTTVELRMAQSMLIGGATPEQIHQRIAEERQAAVMVAGYDKQLSDAWLAELTRREVAQAQQVSERLALEKAADKLERELLAEQTARRVAAEKLVVEEVGATLTEKEILRKAEQKLIAEGEAEGVARRIAAEKTVESAVEEQLAVRAALLKAEQKLIAEGEAERVAAAKAANRLIAENEAKSAAELALIRRGIADRTVGYGAGRLAGSSLATGPVIGITLAVVGAAAATYALVTWTTQAAHAALETRNLSEELDLTWQETRKLQEVAEVAGVKIGTLQQASGRLALALQSNTGASRQTAQALKEMGIEGGSGAGDIFLKFLTKLSQIPDQTIRIEELRKALGRASYEFVPIVSDLTQLQALIDSLGPLLDSGMVAKLSESARQTALLSVEWSRFKQELAIQAAPIVIKVTREITDVLKQQSLMAGDGAAGAIGRAFMVGGPDASAAVYAAIKVLNGEFEKEIKLAQDAQHERTVADQVERANTQNWINDAIKYRVVLGQTAEGMKEELKGYREELALVQKSQLDTVKPLIPEERAKAAKREHVLKTNIAVDEQMIAEGDPTARFQRAEQTAQSEMKRADAVAAAQEAKVHKEQALQSREYTEKLSFIDAMDKLDATRLDKSLSVIASELYTEQNSIDRDRDIENHRYKVKSESLDKLEKAAQTDGKKGLSEQARVADQRFDLETSHAKKLEDLSTQEEAAFVSAKQRGAKEADKITLEQHRRDEEIAHSAEDLARRQSDDAVKAQQITLQSAADTSTKRLELLKTQATFEESQGTISMTRRLSIDRDIAQREYAIEKDSTEKQIVLLSERSAWDTTAASRAASLKEKSASLDAKYAAQQEGFRQREILGLTDSGIAMQKLIAEQNKLNQEGSAMEYTDLQLTLMKTGVDSLRVSYQGLSGVVDSTFKAGAQGFSRVGSSMAESLVTFKGFTAAWKSGLHSIEVEIVGTLINSLIKLGAAQVWLALTNHKTAASASIDYAAQTAAASTYYTTVVAAATAAKLATSIINVDDILGASAVGGANVAAWTAAIPFVGPAVAVEAGMAMANAIDAAFIPFAAYKQGGDIPTDMLAQLHGGEAVLSDDTNSMLRQSLRTGGSGGGSTLVFDFNGAVFHGVPSAQVINPFMNEVVRRLRVAKVIKT